MRRLMAFVLGGLPATPAATRALAATMADWRHEASRAGTATRRLRVATVGVLSVARVLIVSGFRELPAARSAPFLWRTVLMSCVVVLLAVWYDPPLRFVDVLGTRDLIVLALVRAAPAAVLFLPLAAFFSEAVGSRTRVGPSMGALAAMTFIAAVGMLSYPEFAHYQRHAEWALFANAATPAPVAPPSVYRLVVGGPTLPMTLGIGISLGGLSLVLAVATVSLSALGYQVRKRGSLGAWLLGLSPFVSVFAAVWGVMWLLVSLFRPWPLPRDVYALYPPVSVVLTLLSVTVLPLVLAGHLARQARRRETASGSVVTT